MRTMLLALLEVGKLPPPPCRGTLPVSEVFMRILAIINGDYGQRHIENVQMYAPETWRIEVWKAPAGFPLVIDYPEDFLPESLPPAELILSFAEHKGVAELLPDIAQMTGAKAVLAPVDNESWLPRGLARQLRGWLADMDVTCVTPKPLCSLTERDYRLSRRKLVEYSDPFVAEFARYFGQPHLGLTIDPGSKTIAEVQVKRDAVCGCARFVAEGLVGVAVDEAEEKAGLAHHHFPCLASMGIDSDYADTLMHVSGNVLRDNVGESVRPYKRTITPGNRSE